MQDNNFSIFDPIDLKWIKTVSHFVFIQFLARFIGIFSGILIIRYLDKQEYAYFIIANMILGTITVLSDSGISASLSARGGKIWRESPGFQKLSPDRRIALMRLLRSVSNEPVEL